VLAEVGQAMGPPFQLFIFFMITDPRTSPSTRTGRIAYALTVAVIDHLFRLMRNQDAPFYALFVTSPLAILVESYWLGLKEKKAVESRGEMGSPISSS
jgi:Na+-translocating ferredoxin:NAD+ oxidoreductase RnfD subunit